MATLEKIRSKAALLVIVVGLALFSFIIGDFLRSGSTFFHQKKENIVIVNGESVHYQDYQQKVEERTNALKRGNRTFTDDEQNQIRQMVLDEMIDDILFSEETAKIGLVVTNEEVSDLVIGKNTSPVLLQMPDFQNPQTGAFNKDALMRFLQMVESDDLDNYPKEYIPQIMEMKQSWLMIEQQVLKERLRRKFGTLISSAILINNLEAQAAYDDNKVSSDFDYVAQPYSSVADDAVQVSDVEIQKLYNERKTSYKQEEAKVINYIAVNILPSTNDFQAIETKLNGLKEGFASSAREIVQYNSDIPYLDAYVPLSNLDEDAKRFVMNNSVGAVEGPVLNDRIYNMYKFEGEKTAPDSLKLNALMLPMSLDQNTFKHLTDSLIQVVKGGVSFGDMAFGISGGKNRGELGWITEAQLASQIDAQFKDAVFDAKLNEPTLVNSSKGTFLIEVTNKTQPVKKYKVAHIQVHVIPSQETKAHLYNDFSQFVSTHHSLNALKENAPQAGYIFQNNVEVTKNQINIGGIQNTRPIVQWVFNNKNGAISDIFECQNGEYFVVASIENNLHEGYRPLASVSEILKRELINQKKGEKLTAELKEKKLNSLEQYAEAMNTTPQSVKFVTFATPNISGIGNEPILNAEAPVAPIGKIAGPFAGKNRVYVIQVTDRKESDAPYNAELQMKQMQMQNSYRTYQLMQSSELLRENAKIENNLNRFF
ncbi:MAG: SurA N-terminal domain-containing protein [Candidatus Azobacteroides sp.]|nr:SurA N-terminal domain-containing protein [Candidatus Azobacteroides sp.]